jgi:2-keto-4-pentenoate hydratase/2-oxohepta-3-ene-1,7-dioic acid hydratase in catechol pathway
MNLVTFTADGRPHWGVTVPGGVLALEARFPHWPSLRAVIAAGAIPQVLAAAQGQAPSHAEGAYRLRYPMPRKIICVGVNFPDRNAEYKDGQDAPSNHVAVHPLCPFLHRARPAADPPAGEPSAGLRGRDHRCHRQGWAPHSREGEALDHIAALTLCNEGTLRDWVRHAKFNVTQGKNWDASGSIGPWLVPFTDESQLADVKLETRVNGEIRQSDRTRRMMFPFRKIAYISTFTTLVPGDIIVCGTPTGAGARFDPPIWLKPGDVVEVTRRRHRHAEERGGRRMTARPDRRGRRGAVSGRTHGAADRPLVAGLSRHDAGSGLCRAGRADRAQAGGRGAAGSAGRSG